MSHIISKCKLAISSFALVIVLTIVFSCTEEPGSLVADTNIVSFKIVSPYEAPGTIRELARTVHVEVPFQTDLSALQVEIVPTPGTTVTPASGSTVDFSKGPVTFTVSNGGQTSTYSVSVAKGFAVAFLGEEDDIESIAEPDTRAAANWMKDAYGANFAYLKIADLTAEKLANIKVIFWYFDKTGVSRADVIPAAARNETIVNTLKEWGGQGGNFLLAGFGTQYVEYLGRIPSTYTPGIYGDGGGFVNNDNWGINAGTGLTADRRSHPIYANVESTKVINPTTNPPAQLGHDFIPLIDTGHKEDHNSMWDLNAIPELNGAPSKGALFEANTTSLILGTWQHVTDLCCAAVVEFLPTETYEGTIIAIGPASYEWEMNDGRINSFSSNVETITHNAIEYMRSK
jgi:hypothetical protein